MLGTPLATLDNTDTTALKTLTEILYNTTTSEPTP